MYDPSVYESQICVLLEGKFEHLQCVQFWLHSTNSFYATESSDSPEIVGFIEEAHNPLIESCSSRLSQQLKARLKIICICILI